MQQNDFSAAWFGVCPRNPLKLMLPVPHELPHTSLLLCGKLLPLLLLCACPSPEERSETAPGGARGAAPPGQGQGRKGDVWLANAPRHEQKVGEFVLRSSLWLKHMLMAAKDPQPNPEISYWNANPSGAPGGCPCRGTRRAPRSQPPGDPNGRAPQPVPPGAPQPSDPPAWGHAPCPGGK